MSGWKYSTIALESIRFILPRVITRIESGHGFDDPIFMMSLFQVQPFQLEFKRLKLTDIKLT